MQALIDKAAILMEALPYIQEFRDAVVVVKLGGSMMEDSEKTRSVIRDVVFMECAGMRPVLVHGGGKAISAALAEAGIETRFVDGLRYTCDRTIGVVDDVLHNKVNADLVAMMNALDGRPFPMSGKNVLRAEKLSGDSDLGYVGQVVNVDVQQIQWVLNRRQVPIITPLATDLNGTVYNVNADMAACRIAAHLQARKLVFLSDVPGILLDHADDASLISSIALDELEGYITRNVIRGGMVPKVRSAADALRAGCGKVHMIDGRVQHSLLLEIFTVEGIGTQFTH